MKSAPVSTSATSTPAPVETHHAGGTSALPACPASPHWFPLVKNESLGLDVAARAVRVPSARLTSVQIAAVAGRVSRLWAILSIVTIVTRVRPQQDQFATSWNMCPARTSCL
ncbi:MAG: hypothetical protein ABR598_04445, partial [Candidatus Dormibacteria bacterium]